MMNFLKDHIFSFEKKNVENIDHHHNDNKKKEIVANIEYEGDFFNLNKNGDGPKEKIIEKCCICLEEIYSKKKIMMSNCRHQLHIKCAKEWFFENANCPLCRSEQKRLKERICCG